MPALCPTDYDVILLIARKQFQRLTMESLKEWMPYLGKKARTDGILLTEAAREMRMKEYELGNLVVEKGIQPVRQTRGKIGNRVRKFYDLRELMEAAGMMELPGDDTAENNGESDNGN